MAVFSVDSDAVLTATRTIQSAGERVQSETGAMMSHLTGLQGSWTGSAAVAFQSVIDRWRAAQREVDAALADISMALGNAGQQYAQTEIAALGLFR